MNYNLPPIIQMSSLTPLRTLRYPVARALSSNASNKAPILASITVYRPSTTLQSSTTTNSRAGFSTSSVRPATNHDDQYDPPTGWLFGVPPGEKYQNEGWEPAWIWGFWGSLIVGAIAYSFKPDTSIQTWALEEARRRLEAEGILEDPYPNGVPAESEAKSN